MRVYITRSIPSVYIDRLEGLAEVDSWGGDSPVPRAELLGAVADVDGILSMLTDQIDSELLSRAGRLEVVSQMAVGIDNIDVAACRRAGVRVGHTPDVLTDTVADQAIGLVIAAARRFKEGQIEVSEGRWGTWDPWHMLGVEVHGTTLGIIGMGRVGNAVARRAAGFDMDVIYASRGDSGEIGRRVPIGELLAQSDHVVIAVPLTPDTTGLIDDAALESMKSTATLVNVARGPIVESMALCTALQRGEIFAAALDVTDPEPIPADHPLVALDNCMIVPHTASATTRTRHAMAALAVENLVRGLKGEPMVAEVD